MLEAHRARFRLSVLFLAFLPLLIGPVEARAQQPNALAEVFGGIHSGEVKVIDLTHSLDEQSPYWPEGNAPSPFHAAVVGTLDRNGYFARQMTLPEHFGTHMDAPAHFDPKGLTVDRIPLESLLSPAIVVDVSDAARADPDYRVRASDLENWVKAHGPIPRGCVALFRTGWASRWPSQKAFMNQDAQGVLHFPGLSLEAARYLLGQARPVAFGIDTASIDYGPSKDFEVHHLTMSAGLYHLENVANLDQLPAAGTYIIALPMRLRGGSGSPTRAVALFSNQRTKR
jgi:kynurenine formamidase